MDNANKAVPEVEIDLGNGEKYRIKASFGVLIRFQILSGKDLGKTEDRAGMNALDWVTLLAAAICKTPEEARDRVPELQEKVSGKHLTEIAEIIRAIFESADPIQKKEKNQEIQSQPTG